MKLSSWLFMGAGVAVACGTQPAKAPDAAVPSERAGGPAEPGTAPAKPVKPTLAAATVVAAKAAARSWLALVDAEKYAEAWSTTAKGFQSAVTEPDWAQAVAGVRQPLGKLVSRQLRTAEYKTSLPGAPDGTYVVIELDTVFEHKAHAVETVTPTQEPDGTWKVSGYFIK